jgi:hypothetical protein
MLPSSLQGRIHGVPRCPPPDSGITENPCENNIVPNRLGGWTLGPAGRKASPWPTRIRRHRAAPLVSRLAGRAVKPRERAPPVLTAVPTRE